MGLNYTLEQLRILEKIRLSGFKQESPDDMYTTQRTEFKINTELFLDWIAKMESQGKIEYLLKTYKEE